MSIFDSLSLDQVRVIEGVVCIRLLRTNFEVRLYPPEPERVAKIRAREADERAAIPIRMELINLNSGKPVRGFDGRYINAYWLRRFVYDLAGAVAYTEREWDTLPPEYVERMEESL